MSAHNAAVAEATFRCGKCSASFPWAAEHVGRLARCKCGNVLKVPPQPMEGAVAGEPAAAPPLPRRSAVGAAGKSRAVKVSAESDPSADGDGSAPAAAPASSRRAAPASTAVSAPAGDTGAYPSFLRMPSPNPMADLLDADTETALAETGSYGEDPETHLKPNRTRDLHVPVGLLAAGVVMTFIGFNTGGAAGAAVAAVATVVTLVISTVLFIGGGLLAAHFGGIYLGTLGPALLKFAAVSIFPAALADLITELLGGDMAVACLGNGVGIVTCWGLVSYLFRLDGAKTLTVVIAVAVVKIVLGFVLFGVLGLLILSAAPSFDSSDFDSDESVMTSIEDDQATDDGGEADN